MKNIGNCDIKEITAQFGTPVYVYDKQQVIRNYDKLKQAFRKFYSNTEIHYAVKANSNIHILKVFRELGASVDCSSPVEILLSQKAGFTKDQIMYTGNYESKDELKLAVESEAFLNLDDIGSLQRLLFFSRTGENFLPDKSWNWQRRI